MSRLVAFGCSITYGHGLDDCFVPPNGFGEKPSKFAWPNLLGKLLQKRNVINNSSPGEGNLEILYKIINYKFRNNDFCAVYWSYYNRIDLVRLNPDISKLYRLRLENLDKEFLSEEGYNIHTIMRNFLLINHAALYLEKKGIPYFFLDRRSQNLDFIIPFPDHLKPKHYDNSQLDYEFRIDLALDNMHPGKLSQEKIANFMYNKISKMNVSKRSSETV